MRTLRKKAYALAMAVFVPMHISHPGLILFHGIGASLMLLTW